ncbi:MAG: hypothetical protein GEV08_06225 [Acidimicrobiia bacterium]|nr:hypothetical protein [Acidimicrobiia bacterium]
MPAPSDGDDLLSIVVDVYRQTRVELARADLSEHDEVLLLDGAEVLETVLRAEGLDPDVVAHPAAVTTSPT